MSKIFKKVISILLVTVMVFGVAPLAGFVGLELPELNLFSTKAEAATYSGTCGENLTWTFDEATGKLTISGKGAMTNWEYSNAMPWYEYCQSIKSVTILDGVTNIGDYAFYYCENLSGITIPNSVVSIGNDAFGYCLSLENIIIPEGVTIIGNDTFSDCTNLKTVKLPESLKIIGSDAFSLCENLSNIKIPLNVTSIGNSAFLCCFSLTSIEISENVSNIGWGPFAGCTSLTNITVDENNQYYSNDEFGVLFNKEKTELIQYPAGNTNSSYVIPESVININHVAFFFCQNLSNVLLAENVSYIGIMAFQYCSNIESISIPDGVENVYEGTFNFCENLTSIYIPYSVAFIDDAFYGCDNLSDIYYSGSKAMWNDISIEEEDIEVIKNARIHFHHSHSYITRLNSESHWKECTTCGSVIKKQNHSFVGGNTCSCGFKRVVNAAIKIKNNNGSKTINYGETLKLTATVTDKPTNAKIYWYIDGEKKGEGEAFNVKFENGTKIITIKLVDENGVVYQNAESNEISDSENVTVKAGFFQKLISFFKNLFGMNRTVVQTIFKGVF